MGKSKEKIVNKGHVSHVQLHVNYCHESTSKLTKLSILTFQNQKTRHLDKQTQNTRSVHRRKLATMEEKLIQRLEAAVVRLESLSLGCSQPQCVSLDSASASSEPSIVAFDDLITEYVGKVSAIAQKIGGQVKDVTNVLSQAFAAQKELLVQIKQTQVDFMYSSFTIYCDHLLSYVYYHF